MRKLSSLWELWLLFGDFMGLGFSVQGLGV